MARVGRLTAARLLTRSATIWNARCPTSCSDYVERGRTAMSQTAVMSGLLALANVLGAAATQAEGVSFATRRDFAAGGLPLAMTAGDFNRDGIPDLAVANETALIMMLLGNGDGTFTPGERFTAGGSVSSIVASDFNGDGILDLAVANPRSGRV